MCRRGTDSEFKERISLLGLEAIEKMAVDPPKQATKSDGEKLGNYPAGVEQKDE